MSPRRVLALAAALALAACEGAPHDRPAPSTTAETPVTTAPPVGTARPVPPDATRAELAFVRDGAAVRTLTRAALEAAVPPETWTGYDPLYDKPKTWRALPLAAMLETGFGEPAAELAGHDFLLRARDGYTVSVSGAKLLEKGGYVAVADVELPGWEPIGQGRANPGPFYVVWREPARRGLDTHPRPWQLATVEIAPLEATFPHAAPPAADAAAQRGFRLFREGCISCHAMNREGGRVGPDLNVPQSIVEYRPAPQIRAYIRDPRTFRYSNMPAHPSLTEADLDALLAYFQAMKDRKHDPDAVTMGTSPRNPTPSRSAGAK